MLGTCTCVLLLTVVVAFFVSVIVCCEICRTHTGHQLDAQPSPSTMDAIVHLTQKQPTARDEGTLGAETVRRRPGEPTSKLAADSTLSPKVDLTIHASDVDSLCLCCIVCSVLCCGWLSFQSVKPDAAIPGSPWQSGLTWINSFIRPNEMLG